MNPTNWAPGLVVLGAGLLAGIMFVIFSRRASGRASDALPDLEQRYQTLIAQLKELMGDRHLLPPAEFEAEKARLEALAAAALRARENFLKGGGAPAGGAGPSAPPRAAAAVADGALMSGKVRGALIAVGAVAFFVMVGVFLSQETTERTDGGSMTGGSGATQGMPPPPQGMQEDTELTSAMARLSQSPDDVEALAAAAHVLIGRDDYSHAATLTERAVGIDPFHVESRVHRAVIDAVRGRGPLALQELLALADTYPGSSEALLFAGALAMQLGDKGKALDSFERFWASAPPAERPPRLLQEIERLRGEVRAAP